MTVSEQPPFFPSRLSVALGGAGLFAGFVVAAGILSGDPQGRVNLLYVLLLLAFLPALGLVLSVVLLLRGHGRGLSGLVLELPLWPRHWHRRMAALAGSPAQRPWLIYQTQILALSFGAGNLTAFFLLLLGSDVSFIWRSTLLQAEDLLPLLRVLALPWYPWEAAQPSLTLLEATRDFRLAAPEAAPQVLGLWWKYVLAAQCTYNLLPRTVMLVVARYHFLRALRRETEGQGPPRASAHRPVNVVPAEGELAEVVHRVEPGYDLVNWAGAPQFCLDRVAAVSAPGRLLKAGPLASQEEEAASLAEDRHRVVLVKSWEPPMGELTDYLAAGSSDVLPLDWEEDGLRPVSAHHLHEWRRFCGGLPHCRVVQLEEAS